MATLTEYWDEQIKYFDETLEDQLNALAATQNDAVVSCRDAMTTAQNAALDLERDVAAKRRELAEASPSDGAAILIALRESSVAHRRSQAKVLELSEHEASARAELAATFAALERERKRRTEAQGALEAATAAEGLRSTATAKLALPPLVTLVADAEAAKTGQPQRDAKEALGAIPAALFNLAQQAYDHQAKRLADAAELASTVAAARDAERLSGEGVAGTVAVKARAFRDAERVVLQFAGHGASELARAEALLTGVTAATPILSSAEAADAVVMAVSPAVTDQAGSRVTSASAVQAAIVAYTKALLTAQAPAPFADVSAAVATEQATLKAAEDAFRAAQDAMTLAEENEPSIQDTLDDWTRVIPDTAWRRLRDYFDALAILEELSNFPADAVTNLDAAEAEYTTALGDDVAAQRTRAFLEDREAVAQAQLAVLEKQSGIRLISAMRGDFVETPAPMGQAPDEDRPDPDVPVEDADAPSDDGPDDTLDVPEVA